MARSPHNKNENRISTLRKFQFRSHSNPNYALQPGERREPGQGARVPRRGLFHAVGLILSIGKLGKEFILLSNHPPHP